MPRLGCKAHLAKWNKCFMKSPEPDLFELTVGPNKTLMGPLDISNAISMPVKMPLALCNRIMVHGLIGPL